MGRKAGRRNQQNTRSHAAPSRGRRVLGIAVNSGDQSIAMRWDYSKQHSIELQPNTAMRRDYSTAEAAAAAT